MDKLEGIFGKGWAEQLSPFLRSKDFDDIGKIIQKSKVAKQLTPEPRDMFRAFRECPWEKLHTVILAGGPYISAYPDTGLVADGLAFSARTSRNTPRTLKEIIEAIDEEVYEYKPEESFLGWDNDLSYLANQGILLLNTGITADIKKGSSSHIYAWKPFISYIIKLINHKKDKVGVILFGDYAQAYKDLFDNPSFAVFTAELPLEAIQKNKTWKSNNVFKDLTDFQKVVNQIKISW